MVSKRFNSRPREKAAPMANGSIGSRKGTRADGKGINWHSGKKSAPIANGSIGSRGGSCADGKRLNNPRGSGYLTPLLVFQ